MKKFDYFAPGSVKEAVTLLRERGPEGKVLAGGTDLIVQIRENMKGIAPSYLVSLKNLAELRGLEYDVDKGLKIGALTTLRTLIESPVVQEQYPILAQAADVIGSVQIQNVATVGGNLCNAAPSADMAPPLITLGAEVTIVGPDGERTLLLEDFFTGPGQTVLAPDQILTEIHVPPPLAHSGGAYMRHTTRQRMDIAVVGVGSFVILDEAGACQDLRIALGAVAPTPIRAKKTEAVLRGQTPEDNLIEEAARVASEECRPISDVRGSAEFRRHLVGVLTKRTLGAALAAAGS
ncbi:MAG: FAD binding domain-containing protein [Anaerolineae bacterium]